MQLYGCEALFLHDSQGANNMVFQYEWIKVRQTWSVGVWVCVRVDTTIHPSSTLA